MITEKIEKISLVNQVYSSIIKHIQNGTIAQGERLNIEELAKAFGVSRTPVREAISKLTQDGFVEEIHNSGPRVIEFNSKQILDGIRCNMTLFSGVIDSYKTLTTNAYNDMIHKLGEALSCQQAAHTCNDFDLFYKSSVQFHTVLIESCPNEMIKKYTMQTHQLITMCMVYYQKDVSIRERGLQEHRKIFESLKSKKIKEANSLMIRHNCLAEETFQEPVGV